MRRGCVSLGEIKCDECQNVIPYPDRYLAVDEKDGMEDEEEVNRVLLEAIADGGDRQGLPGDQEVHQKRKDRDRNPPEKSVEAVGVREELIGEGVSECAEEFLGG